MISYRKATAKDIVDGATVFTYHEDKEFHELRLIGPFDGVVEDMIFYTALGPSYFLNDFYIKDTNPFIGQLWNVKMYDSGGKVVLTSKFDLSFWEKIQEFFCWHQWMDYCHLYNWPRADEQYCIHCGKWRTK